MAQWLNWGKGTSGSPNSISGTINTYATCTGTAGQTSLTTALSASAGDQILIHQTQGTGAGNWEICEVVSDAGSTLNLKTALVNSYGTGSQAVLIPQYTGGNISGAVTGTSWNGSIGGIIALMSNGDLTISGSITAPTGFRYGNLNNASSKDTGYRGEGYNGNDQAKNTAQQGNGGGGGGGVTGYDGTGGGGGGGNGTAGTTGGTGQSAVGGVGGASVGNAGLTSMFLGGGGGGASRSSRSTYGNRGGAGSGIIVIFAKSITTSSGSIVLNGETGYTSDGGYPAGSGGGAGGSCLIKCQSATMGTNKITASGGNGGSSTVSGAGGAGGVGRIRCDYFTSVSGSTNPTLSSAQDLTLNVPASSGFFNFF